MQCVMEPKANTTNCNGFGVLELEEWRLVSTQHSLKSK